MIKKWTLNQVLDTCSTVSTLPMFECVLNYAVSTQSISVNPSTGAISVSQSYSRQTVTIIDKLSWNRLLMKYRSYWFEFSPLTDETTAATAFNSLFQSWYTRRKSDFERMYGGFMTEYNPVYNVEENNVNWYNLLDKNDRTYTGSKENSHTYAGDVKTGTKQESATAGTSRAGKTGYDATSSYDMTSNTVSATVTDATAGTTVKETMFINSYEDDTSTAPAKATDSRVSEGDSFTGNKGTVSGVTIVNYDGYSVTDNESFTNRKDADDGSHKGQDAFRRWGNIGVVSSTELLEKEVNFRIFTDIQQAIFELFLKEYCWMGDVDDDD